MVTVLEFECHGTNSYRFIYMSIKSILIESCYGKCNIQRKGWPDVVLAPKEVVGELFGNSWAPTSSGILPERLVLLTLLS